MCARSEIVAELGSLEGERATHDRQVAESKLAVEGLSNWVLDINACVQLAGLMTAALGYIKENEVHLIDHQSSSDTPESVEERAVLERNFQLLDVEYSALTRERDGFQKVLRENFQEDM